MKAFSYQVAANEEEALKLLGPGRLALAGGTSLLNLLKDHVLEPESVVSILRIQGLGAITPVGDTLQIGANVKLVDLVEDAAIKKSYAALAQAADNVASPQIRNMGTVGGNLCQRPYCWYFTRPGLDCLKRGGKACAARDGDNEYHAILATDGPCVAVSPSSLAPALVALGARVKIASPGGAREIPVEELFVLPAASVERETSLAPNELITHLVLPAPTRPQSAVYEVRSRAANDWPLASAAVALRFDGANVAEVQICLGGVAPVPWRARAAEAALLGKPLDAALAQAAAARATEGAKPLARNAYKVQLAQVAVQRALLALKPGA